MAAVPTLTQFRVETSEAGVVHLIFDAPGRAMNVFSEAAIEDLGAFAGWLATSDAKGVVVRSGKPSAFCAGADLNELGLAYDMIMAAPKARRFDLAFAHFSPLGRACRALETSGKPVAAAIGGLALGGGCELALACHHRILVDDPKIGLGLPESLVGLLPGSGGTQRLPRLIGVEAALPILLDGARLAGRDALDAGLVDRLVRPGEEVEAAEAWVLSDTEPRQPWDRAGWRERTADELARIIGAAREDVLAKTHGHYPAPLAILDCIERGLPQPFDQAIRTEMEIFSVLIQRPEPRNMIQTSFLGKLEHDKREKANTLPPLLPALIDRLRDAVNRTVADCARAGMSKAAIDQSLKEAGFTHSFPQPADSSYEAPIGGNAGPGEESSDLWFEAPSPAQRAGARAIVAGAAAIEPCLDGITPGDARLINHAISRATGFPTYLGGPIAVARYLGASRLRQLVAEPVQARPKAIKPSATA